MDGNGRWAKARHLPRVAGHKKGAESAKAAIESCIKHKIQYLTLYAFSSENWGRPEDEVKDLMNLLRFYLDSELKNLHKNNVRLRFVGDTAKLEKDIQDKITAAEKLTENNTALTACIALSYGSRQEITNAIKAVAKAINDGTLKINELDEDTLSNYLYTKNIPDPDLLIRTGGDQRLSNFLLWQSAYTELYFTECFWPEFTEAEFTKAVEAFHSRERRFGQTSVKEAI